jgi:hypothetical protein
MGSQFPLSPTVAAHVPGGTAGTSFRGSTTMKGFPMSSAKFPKGGDVASAPPLSGKPLAGTPLCLRSLVAYLRAAFPHSTAKQAGYLIGAPAKTVEKWLAGECAPSAMHLSAMIAVFGPPFIAAAMPRAAWAREAVHDAAVIDAANRLTEAIRQRLVA